MLREERQKLEIELAESINKKNRYLKYLETIRKIPHGKINIAAVKQCDNLGKMMAIDNISLEINFLEYFGFISTLIEYEEKDIKNIIKKLSQENTNADKDKGNSNI